MDWKIFEVKYEGKETSKFEELAYKLFCSEFECETGIFRYHNQTGIETEPINKNGKNYGFQAKYYTTSISSNKTDIIDSIKKAKSKNPALNIIYLYLNKELSESSKINQKKPIYQMEIEKDAKKLQIEIVWRVPSNLEIQLSLPENRYIYNEFFHLGEIIGDEKLISQIKNLNNEYKKLFSSLKAGLIERKEIYDCIEKIKKDNSIIIHGKAGYGKSGCTMGIINYCEEKEIEYIAIKLDKRIPNGNLLDWSKKLGFPLTIPEAINQISSDKKAVIILDQLDAIRWTESNSYEAISICTELINKVKKLNIDREQKISIIFVCRTYDLENDNNIKFLFNQNNENELKWEKIEVEKLSKEDTKELVGEKYLNFIPKLKDLLRIPSNLYIWEHLDLKEDKVQYDIRTTKDLIKKWFEQLQDKAMESRFIKTGKIEEVKNILISDLEKSGKLYSQERKFNSVKEGLKYLNSAGMLNIQGDKVSFFHQSIFDYFISELMIEKYEEGLDIIEIIGDKDKQTPNRRYQIQMFLQTLLEESSEDFIDIGEKMLNNDKVRHYIKYLFYEILSQISKEEIDEVISEYIVENCEREDVFHEVIYGRKYYISILRDNKVLDKWFNSNLNEKEKVFKLLKSQVYFYNNFDIKDFEFIQKYSFNNLEDDKKIIKTIQKDKIYNEIDKIFDLRIEFYKKYPEWIDKYIDIKEIPKKEERMIIFLELCLSKNIQILNEHQIQDILDYFTQNEIKNEEFVFEKLLEKVPRYKYEDIKYKNCDWNGSNNKYTIERLCLELLKRASIKLVLNNDFDKFYSYYEKYIGKDFVLFNEIILHCFEVADVKYSDKIIKYICENFEENKIFDITSNSNDKLKVLKNIIKKHSENCNEKLYLKLEDKIYYYCDPYYRIYLEYYRKNKSKTIVDCNIKINGQLQKELFSYLPLNRKSKKIEDLEKVLERKFLNDKITKFKKGNNFYGGTVVSPIKSKEIGEKQWLKILTNKKLYDKKSQKKVEEGFIESSLEMYTIEFSRAVSRNPQKMIDLVIKNKKDVLKEFIELLFDGVSRSEYLNKLSQKKLEKLFLEFPCDYKSRRAIYFCDIIRERSDFKWSNKILEHLKDIVVNHNDFKSRELNIWSSGKKNINNIAPDSILLNSINGLSGSWTGAVSQILRNTPELFYEFKDFIEKIIQNENIIINFSVFEILNITCNIEKEWTLEKLINLYEKDIRLINHFYYSLMLKLYFSEYKERFLKVIEKCYSSQYKDLIEIGAKCILKLYLDYGDFKDKIEKIYLIDGEKLYYILEELIRKFDSIEYNNEIKEIILKLKEKELNYYSLEKLFNHQKIDLSRDKKFLLELMKFKNVDKIIHSFLEYLEERVVSILDYADVIINLCENILSKDKKLLQSELMIMSDISKLTVKLYDETSNSKSNKNKEIAMKCLDFWDIMYEKGLVYARETIKKLMNR
ncbi:hypothetical protein [Leptotrichia wadei]|uniref:hypothetical protein n=1 Tax=Leptotrichia wadei TaxID=157687 RepID=UPI0028D74C3C|nr:hypothetical protein [Leptotrichia wadei]